MIEGDLQKEGLGLSATDAHKVMTEVDIVFNVAASVNFDDHLHDALWTNYFGVLNLLAIAEQSKSVKTFTHVSTAYVNSDKQGRIDEKIYDLPSGQDPEQIVHEIMQLSREEACRREPLYLGHYPNTYTFTKSLTERTLKKRKSPLKVCIVRPSIVISAFEEPFLGWTETISAMGGLLFAGILGLINYLQVDPHQILDLVPVDYVSNLILASANYNFLNGVPGEPLVVHCSSSQLNRVKIWDIVEILKANAQFNASDKQQKTPAIYLTTSPLLYNSLFFFTQALPVKILAKISTMPVIGNQKLEARAKTFARLIDKMNSMQGLFLHFTNNEFIYDSTNSQKIWSSMSPND